MSRWLEGLNPAQRKAVRAVEGPVLVLAGAGSGKTLVITRRIAYMLSRGIRPGQILGVTFTNKAAAEMRERLAAMAGRKASGVTLSTFHALGLHMLRTERARQKKRTRFVIHDTGDQLACLREIARRLRLERSFDLGAILARISAWKNAFLQPGDLEPGDDPYEQAAAAFYPAYLEAMEGFAALDFDDLICGPVGMMERSDACRRRWSERFRYVLVDEYQDTNAAQLRMLRALAGEHRNLCVVGDDDQSIYGWRGAEVRNILRFERDFPGCKVIRLERNYRSVGTVLRLANAVIAQNPARHPKQLEPDREEGAPVRLRVAEDGEAEAAWVAEQTADMIRTGRRRPGEVAVLYRAATLGRVLETAFRAERVPYRVVGGKSFFDRKEVKDLIAYLKVCVHPGDSISLRRIINWPARGIGPTTLGRLASWAEERDLPLSKAVERAAGILPRGDRAAAAVESFRELVAQNRRRLSRGGDLAGGVRALVEEIGMQDEIRKGCQSGAAAERRWGLVEEFLQGIESAARNRPGTSLREYLNQITLHELEEDDEREEKGESVTLSTLHGAKGLEFPVVFLVGLEEGLLPHERVVQPHVTDADAADVAEERRLCYVGITRARDELILTRAARRVVRGRPADRAPSRFLANLPDGLLQIQDTTRTLSPDEARSQLARIRASLEK